MSKQAKYLIEIDSRLYGYWELELLKIDIAVNKPAENEYRVFKLLSGIKVEYEEIKLTD